MFPLDQQDIDHLAPEGWLRIASLVAIALEVLGLGVIPLPRGLAAKALLVPKPAEAMARRLLYLMGPISPSPRRKPGPRAMRSRSRSQETLACAGTLGQWRSASPNPSVPARRIMARASVSSTSRQGRRNRCACLKSKAKKTRLRMNAPGLSIGPRRGEETPNRRGLGNARGPWHTG